MPVDPHDHAYHQAPSSFSGDYNPWRREHEPTDHEERQQELAGEDEDSGYNWGPPPNPNHIPESHVGGVLRQSEQFATRIADQLHHSPNGVDSADQCHYDDYGPEENDWERQRADEPDLEHFSCIDDQFYR
jgi:hypothetical protein